MLHQLWRFLVYDCKNIEMNFEEKIGAGFTFTITETL